MEVQVLREFNFVQGVWTPGNATCHRARLVLAIPPYYRCSAGRIKNVVCRQVLGVLRLPPLQRLSRVGGARCTVERGGAVSWCSLWHPGDAETRWSVLLLACLVVGVPRQAAALCDRVSAGLWACSGRCCVDR
jgi:hypothetical protein